MARHRPHDKYEKPTAVTAMTVVCSVSSSLECIASIELECLWSRTSPSAKTAKPVVPVCDAPFALPLPNINVYAFSLSPCLCSVAVPL